jgi:uncharacterized protein (TIGR00725 family)
MEVKRMELHEMPIIAVYGSVGGSEIKKLRTQAYTIGSEIAKSKCILATGACPGIPHEAAIGAADQGGLILGFSPAMNLKEHIEVYEFPVEPYVLIFTGMQKKGRNVISTRTAKAAIFISGRFGTLNEFTNIYDEADETKVVGILRGSGGFVDEFIIPSLKNTEKPTKARIVIKNTPGKLVEAVVKFL